VNHPFLVGLEYAFQTNQKLYFVLQFMQGGELFQHLRAMKRFSEYQAKFYAASIVLGIGHMHNKNYIYRDLKLENLLLDGKGYAMITDFGLAKFITPEQRAMTFCGTPEYLSPEVLLGKGHNRPTDWWTLGVLIYEMIFGIPPFYNQVRKQMYQKIVKEAVVFKPNITISGPCMDIILKLLEKDQTKRLGSKNDSLEVISHPWFSEIDIDALTEKKLKAPFTPDLKNWEKNFDKEYMAEKPDDIKYAEIDDKVEIEILEKFQNEFNTMNYNKDLLPADGKK
jgi:serum/glucocorticoid-regulated kinase 2